MQAASLANNPALRSQVETQVNFMTELSQRTYDSVRKVGELNMHYTQQLIEDSINMGRELMSCSDPFQMTSTAISQLQPATEHLRNYQRQLIGVLSGVQADLTRAAGSRIPQATRQASAMADEMVRNAAAAAADAGAAHNPT
jgi:phasin family protein